jgi:hypothetical protein
MPTLAPRLTVASYEEMASRVASLFAIVVPAAIACGCGGSVESQPGGDAPRGAPKAKSNADTAFEPSTIAPSYQLSVTGQVSAQARVWFTNARGKLERLGPTAEIRVNGVVLEWLATCDDHGCGESGYDGTVPFAADGVYVFELDVGGRVHTTSTKAHDANLLVGDRVKFQSPLVVGWDRDLPNVKALLKGCFLPDSISFVEATGMTRSAAFPVTRRTSPPCGPTPDTELSVVASTEVALELGTPFLPGKLASSFVTSTHFALER